ncbi:unnamed protein product [Aphanomyces euteiches]|uniref:Uncharacterized protein n=1 Tax=Aphanomyces euteiches TaxID=100861 RepID=A0A6G0XAU7_9STRA|nr:hypothetical protein Ae201684_006904 [Aphanomyces euteiches]KAH9087325.1 hypothetical protein Ae201684P_000736 [Aphanomyces euteiches]KAH9158079.1 hypothetical protein AeRB84_000115 [Aphanomyces euteiches]
MSSLYSFPVLKMSEIFQFMRETKVPVSEEDIKNCDPAAVRRIFEVFLDVILGVGKDDMSQPALSGLSALQHPNLHEESIPELAFLRTTKKMMDACGVHDFKWQDILRPNPKRLRRQLSAMINFSKFKQERKDHFDQFRKRTDDALKAKQLAEEENAALRRKLEELKAKREAEAPAIQAVNDECTELEGKINVLNERQSILRHEMRTLKGRAEQLRDDLASQQMVNMDAKKTIESMQAKIVNSPARFKSEIGDLAVQVDEAKEAVNALDGRSAELEGIYDTVSRAAKETQKVMDLLEAIEIDVTKCRMEKENLQHLYHELNAIANKTKVAVAHKTRVEKLIEQRREQFKVYMQQARTNMQAYEHAKAAAANELEQMRQVKSSDEHRISSTLQAVQDTHAKLNLDREAYEMKLKDMEETYLRMDRKVRAYTKMLTEVVAQ